MSINPYLNLYDYTIIWWGKRMRHTHTHTFVASEGSPLSERQSSLFIETSNDITNHPNISKPFKVTYLHFLISIQELYCALKLSRKQASLCL